MTERNPDRDDRDRRRGFDFGITVDFLSDIIDELMEVNVRQSTVPEAVNENSGVEVSGHLERRRDMPDTECLLDTHYEDDTFVVLADIPGANLDELTVGIHPRDTTLVIARNENILGRVPLPAQPTESPDALFNNGVLEVRVNSASA